MGRVKIDNLTFYYQHAAKPALDGVSFEVNQNETVGILGSNGSGKTTLCYLMCGIIPHYIKGVLGGGVYVNAKDTKKTPLANLSAEIGIILQDPNEQLIMPTVEEEVTFALENNNLSRKEMRQRVDEVFSLLGIGDIKNENPISLSGGQKQLVTIAAVLAQKPKIIIFDEAIAMLDKLATAKIIAVMQALKAQKTTLIIVDHTLKTLNLLDRAMILEQGQLLWGGKGKEVLSQQELLKNHELIIN